MNDLDHELREAVVASCRELARKTLARSASGNVSVRRDAKYFLVTATGAACESLEAKDITLVNFDGRWFGQRRPSSEWRIHRDIYRARPDVGAIVHTHSMNATALACTGQGIPAFHYMVARAGGSDVRCAPYCTFGTQELSDAALEALTGRQACLLANHGVIALGEDLDAAVRLAEEVEILAAQYGAAVRLGEVQVLDEAEMARVLEKFRTYGTAKALDPDLRFAGTEPRSLNR